MKDYFNILGVQPNASEDEIRTAYKKLAMKHHPDRGGDQAQFQAVQEAYATLTDPGKRAEWEHQRAFGGAHPGQGGFGFQFNFGPDINDIIHQFHGGHHFFGQGFGRQRNRDLRTVIELDLASTLAQQTKYVEIRDQNGQTRTVQVNVPRGVQSGMQMRFPGHGDNSLKNVAPGDLFVEFVIRPHPDYRIEGLNLIRKTQLNAIDAILGKDINIQSLDNKVFEVKIPPGTQQGTNMSLNQQGLYDINTGRRGDLVIEINIEIPHKVTQEQIERLRVL